MLMVSLVLYIVAHLTGSRKSYFWTNLVVRDY